MPPAPQFIEANTLRFGYLEWGEKSAPLVLMFHGFPDTAETWDVIGPRVAAAGFRVVAPYMRGYVPTTIPPRDTRIAELAYDVVGLIEAFGAEKARIVGHDWGAEAVIGAATIAPHRVERLVHVALPHRTTVTPTPMLAWRVRHFGVLKLPGAAKRFARNGCEGVDELCRRWSPTWKFTPKDLAAVKKAFEDPACLNAALGYYRALGPITPETLKPPVKVPTLAVAGRDDPTISVAHFERAKVAYTASYEVAAIGGGHFCHRESPEEFIAAVTKFLA